MFTDRTRTSGDLDTVDVAGTMIEAAARACSRETVRAGASGSRPGGHDAGGVGGVKDGIALVGGGVVQQQRLEPVVAASPGRLRHDPPLLKAISENRHPNGTPPKSAVGTVGANSFTPTRR